MALNSPSRIEPFHFEGARASIKSSFILIGFWALWISLFTTLSVPLRISLHGTSIMLLVGAFWWGMKEGAFYLLLMSFIYSAFSLTPSGFFWLSSFLVFVVLRFASYRFTVSSRFQIFLTLFLISFVFDVAQMILAGQVLATSMLSGKLLLSIFYSSILQASVGWLCAPPLLAMIEAK